MKKFFKAIAIAAVVAMIVQQWVVNPPNQPAAVHTLILGTMAFVLGYALAYLHMTDDLRPVSLTLLKVMCAVAFSDGLASGSIFIGLGHMGIGFMVSFMTALAIKTEQS